MYESFENLSEDKKDSILEACIREFAEKGYENASTNTITREAGISKGILFHYFHNKKSLFLYVFDYCIKTLVEEYNKYSLTETGDIFQRLSELSVIKLKLTHVNPEKSKLLMKALAISQEDLRTEVERRYSRLTKEYMPEIFKKIDYSKFRSEVDPLKAIEILMLFLEALGDKYMKRYRGGEHDLLQNYDKLIEEYNEYMEILKFGMYSE
jgi:Transcriptional regulator